MLKLTGFLLAFLLFSNNESNYLSPEEYFGDSYLDALTTASEYSVRFEKLFQDYGTETHLALAIVFPEMIRYNRFRNFFETKALEIAYVEGGKGIADFSIGNFQMKPSFVESLEELILKDTIHTGTFGQIAQYPLSFNEKDVRRERIARLKQQEWQVLYLISFLKLSQTRFEYLLKENPSEKLMVLSSAYNLSPTANIKEIKLLATKKTFPYGKLGINRFSYYDIARDYYQKHNNSHP